MISIRSRAFLQVPSECLALPVHLEGNLETGGEAVVVILNTPTRNHIRDRTYSIHCGWQRSIQLC